MSDRIRGQKVSYLCSIACNGLPTNRCTGPDDYHRLSKKHREKKRIQLKESLPSAFDAITSQMPTERFYKPIQTNNFYIFLKLSKLFRISLRYSIRIRGYRIDYTYSVSTTECY